MREIHLLCNAHLDPVWQWQWNEGAGAGLSTFRSAVEICEENDDLIFCHNEAHLYQIIEEYEPDLFARIQILVTKGQWHIMGGWYLQPDCNLPCGESFVRQMLIGRNYFFEKFHTVPKIAVNFDSFGHTRGLVQILKKGAYKGYVFMRPDARELDLPADDFAWIGVDGSVLPCHRIMPGYNSAMGEATDKIEQWIKKYPDTQKGLVTWGIGNHGGGPSRKDVKEIRATMIRHPEYKMHHSTPECYFCDTDEVRLLRYQGDLRPNQIGSYTSQQSIKKTYRLLENELWKTEKMLSAANLLGVMEYPENDLKQVQRDLLTAQFHDILAGTSIEPVEQDALRLMHHGLEILSRLATKAFFALCIGQPKALSDETPILILNPHPYPVEGIFCCEYSLEDQNWSEQFTVPTLWQDGAIIPSQLEKENSNIIFIDWRKRLCFHTTLAPSGITRINAKKQMKKSRPQIPVIAAGEDYIFRNDRINVVINGKTGLLDRYQVDGVDYILPNACKPIVMEDSDDSWAMAVSSFSNQIGEFELTDANRVQYYAGLQSELSAMHLIEDGAVRTVIEVVFTYQSSCICQTYALPKSGTEIQVDLRIKFVEPGKMLKLSIPTPWENAAFEGQTAYGTETIAATRQEQTAQKWVSASCGAHTLTVINNSLYGLDCFRGVLRLSLIRGCAYTAHPSFDDAGFDMTKPVVPQDRYLLRSDQDWRHIQFWLQGDCAAQRKMEVDKQATTHNETPHILSYFPAGVGEIPMPAILLSNQSVLLTAFKKCENKKGFILRFFETQGENTHTTLDIPICGIHCTLSFTAFEIKTMWLQDDKKTLQEVPLLEDDVYYQC